MSGCHRLFRAEGVPAARRRANPGKCPSDDGNRQGFKELHHGTDHFEPLLTHEETRVADGVKTLNDVINKQFPSALQQAVSGLSNAKDRQTLQILSEQIVQNVRQQPRSVQEPSSPPNRFRFTPRRKPSIISGNDTLITYKEATLNPTNPRDRTLEWEAELVNIFNKNPAKTELVGYRDTPEGPDFTTVHRSGLTIRAALPITAAPRTPRAK